MKKMKISILSIFIVLSMLVAFTGCSTSETSKFVGTWKTTVSMDEMLNEYISAGDETMAEYVTIKDFTLTLLYTFNEDGTYTITVDEDVAKEALKKLQDSISQGIKKYLEDMIAAQGLDMSIDDLLSEMGITIEDLVDEMMDVDSMIEGFESEGKWKVEDGKLYTTDSAGAEFDESVYETYEISGTKLTLLEVVGEDLGEFGEILYPIVMTKVQ